MIHHQWSFRGCVSQTRGNCTELPISHYSHTADPFFCLWFCAGHLRVWLSKYLLCKELLPQRIEIIIKYYSSYWKDGLVLGKKKYLLSHVFLEVFSKRFFFNKADADKFSLLVY